MIDQPLHLMQANGDDFLWQQLKSEPAFRALLRAVEARFYQKLDLPQPILDLGCGNGHFAQTAFNQPIQVGIDSDWNELHNAEKQGVYDLPLQATSRDLPFPDHYFGSAFSNSTLSHISEIQPVLNEISRVLKPGAPLALTVPSQNFTTYLSGVHFLKRLGFKGMSGSYGNLINRISHHAQTEMPEVWAERLALAGFAIDRWQYYFSRDALRAFEKGHIGSIPSAIIHAVTGHWILGPWESNLKWADRWARPHYEEEFPIEGAFIFMLARKNSDEAISAVLPPANPFTVQELISAEEITSSTEPSPEISALPAGVAAVQAEEEPANLIVDLEQELETPAINWRPVITGTLVGLILMFAFWGQSAIQDSLDDPGSGLSWFGLSALMLVLLIWYQQPRKQINRPNIRIPSLKDIPQRRWLYLFALLLVLFAPRLVVQDGAQRPGFAIILWLVAIGVAIFAFLETPSVSEDEPQEEMQPHPRNNRFDLIVSIVLFLVALLPRLYQLSSHPFILNGTEANIGLDVLNVIQGTSANPFSTAWLTNPTLPLYLLAVPIRLLGPTVMAIRLISPFIGAITVVSVYLIGQRLYGRTISLTAAVLLLGSHFHVHFSRLGLTNVWDALLVLLALGFIAIAWQMNPKKNRTVWLLAGLATGLNAYLYTSSHLLPLILIALFLITLLFEGSTWRRQWRHVLAMGAIALVVALPQILHYQANPGLYMERANVMGILESQSGWLSREAVQSGTSQLQLLTKQLWRASLGFNATLDTGTSYGPFVPLLNFAAGILALLGFFLALLRSRQLRFSMLFVWITVTIIFGGALIENPPNSHRYIIAAPAVMLVAALALVELTSAVLGRAKKADHETIDSRLKNRKYAALLIVPLIIAAVITVYDIGYYFGPYKTQHHFADRNTEIANDIAHYLNSLEGDWSAYFFGPPSMYVGFSTIPFLVQDFQEGRNLFDVPEPSADLSQTTDMQLQATDSPNLVFIYLPERQDELEETKAAYPDGQVQTFEGYFANPLFYVYEVRPDSR